MSEFSNGYNQGWRDAEKARAERDKSAGMVSISRDDLRAMLTVYDDRNTMELSAGAHGAGIGEDIDRVRRLLEVLK